MISLKKGTYLDHIDKIIEDGHIIASLSTYYGSYHKIECIITRIQI
jgi:hypothetical protein